MWDIKQHTNNRQNKVIKSSRKLTLTIKLGSPESEGTMDGSTLGCVEGTRDGCSDVLGATHSFGSSTWAIGNSSLHLSKPPLSQQSTVLETPSGSTTVKLVTRGELLGANEGSLLSDGWNDGWFDGCRLGALLSLGTSEGTSEGILVGAGCQRKRVSHWQ